MKRLLIGVIVFTLFCSQFACQKKSPVYSASKITDKTFFRDWLVCGPFPNCPECIPEDFKHDERCRGYFTDYLESIGGEENAIPQSGTIVEISDIDIKNKWFHYKSETDKVELNDLFTPNDMVVAYAFCQITSPVEQKTILSVGSNDAVKVFLNGKKVHDHHIGRWIQADNDFVPVTLKQGLNNLLLKIGEGTGNFGFIVRLLDYDSTLTAIRDNLDNYKALTLVAEDDTLVAQFGTPYKIGTLSPGTETTVEIRHDKTGKLIKQKALPGAKMEFSLADIPNGFLSARASFQTPSDGLITSEKRHFKGKLKRHAFPARLDRKSLAPTIDGKPFFPIGTYGAPPEDYAKLKKAGYNFVVASVNNLDKVHEAGLKAAVHVHGVKPHWFSAVRDTITKYKNHPAILCWMLYDEPAYNKADLLDIYKLYNTAYQADSVHPSYLVVTTPTAYTTFGRCCDILSVDTYPIASGIITAVGDNIAKAYRDSDGDVPVWHCGQMFKWPAQRRPTPQEHRFMTYTSLIEGVKGMLWYTYKGYGQYMPTDDPELWEEHKKILAEVNDLAPLYLEQGLGDRKALTNKDLPIQTMLKKCSLGTFVIAANTSKTETITPEFNVKMNLNSQASVYGENRSLEVNNGQFKDTFKPLDIHIYKLN